MKTTQTNERRLDPPWTTGNRRALKVMLVATIVATTALVTMAQNSPPNSPHAQHRQPAATSDSSLNDQLAELRAKVARLEAALGGPHLPQPAPSAMPGMAPNSTGRSMGVGGPGMGMQREMRRMNMGEMMGVMKDMDMMKMMGMEKMKMMGRMGGMKGMNMPSALPGFPGASHLYHIGATGYFLDHPEHITLSTEQQVALNRVMEQAELNQSSLDRKIAEGEQELWVLTSSDQPNAGKIEAKIREIEKIRGDQRLAFIRSVGDAAQVLTQDQRQVLTGLSEPQTGSAEAAHQHAGAP